MKVKTWVEFEQEVDVEVSIADVMSAISELAESDQAPMIRDCISSVHRTLNRVPDERIAEMTTQQREIIFKALREQAYRFAVKPPC